MTDTPDPIRTGAHHADPGDLVEFVAAEEAAAPGGTGVPHRTFRERLVGLGRQLVGFGLVGGIGFAIDMGVYNLLIVTVLSDDHVHGGPLLAKVLSTLVAITTNWIGNRFWTFRHHRQQNSTREGLEYFGVSLAGLVVGLLPLWIIHYGLGFDSLPADNISNVIGLGLGSVFRFVLYRWWVFSPRRQARARA